MACFRLGAAEAAFTVMHGLGHYYIGEVLCTPRHFSCPTPTSNTALDSIHRYDHANNIELLVILQVLGDDFMGSVRPSQLPLSLLLAYYLLMLTFLALGPYLGHLNDVPMFYCITLHFLSIYAFMAFVPQNFAFGGVQLCLNTWYCLPRVFNVGVSSAEDVSRRVDDGWWVVSYGFLLLMPVVFIEMLACDSFLLRYFGHFVYDGSILLISVWYSIEMWRQCDRKGAH